MFVYLVMHLGELTFKFFALFDLFVRQLKVCLLKHHHLLAELLTLNGDSLHFLDQSVTFLLKLVKNILLVGHRAAKNPI